MSVTDSYAAKRRSALDAIDLVQDGDTIIVPTGAGEPPALLEALSERRREKHDVQVAQILPVRPYDYMDAETVENVRHTAFFINGPTRKGAQAGWVDYLPHFFADLPELFRRGAVKTDVVFALASPMDKHGYFSIGLSPDYTMDAIDGARAVVLEVNPGVPFAYGECLVHIDEVTAVVEDDRPVLEIPLPEVTELQQRIGGHVADLIPDGATIQIGFGGIPDAVVQQLKGRADLGVHTEMFGDGILSLVEAGAVTNKAKNIDRGIMKATFALGTRKLYDWMDHNPALRMCRVETTNDPFLAGAHDKLHTINATLQVDLLGQCCSESLGAVPYSGTGGQVDFVRAANRSKGGKSFIVLPSTAKGDTISRIQPTLTQGAVVTTGKNDVDYVVTEYGVAQLRGKTAHQRAAELIAIAHPKFRDQLADDATKMGLY